MDSIYDLLLNMYSAVISILHCMQLTMGLYNVVYTNTYI